MRTLFNEGWEFSKQKPGAEAAQAGSFSYTPVELPHDWLIYQASDLYESSTGFYRKRFSYHKSGDERCEIYFEGVYMDSTLYVNGKEAGCWKYGYSSFFFDITELLTEGENTLLLQVVHLSPNSRWYSGAGIYRDVYLITHPAMHIITDSLYISAKPEDTAALDGVWKLRVSAELAGFADREAELCLRAETLGIEKKLPLKDVLTEEGDGYLRVEFTESVTAPKLWSPEDPQLFDAELSLSNGDSAKSSFGFRSFVCDTQKGFFLNNKHVKINGVCEHHDLGALGAVFYKNAFRRKLLILREMGVNAIRTSHNMPAVGLLELCDEMGFLVMDEAFDMWEGSKTTYDYARFFKEWHARDVRSWVRRDRNHPCVFMWSIGNEIYDTHKDAHGREITEDLKKLARENDPYENAVVGIASNYMAWEGAQNCAEVLKYAGFNYGERLYDEQHAAHPDWYIFGSETCSTVQSRGIYHFPLKQTVLADDDLQCSSLGNSSTSWGAPNTEYCIIAERDHDFSLGQFLWTGFDYIGEPTPYHTRNSYFGQIDTAGFPKDCYYVYKSAWTDHRKAPFVHLFPYWNFNPGQLIDVRIATNAPEAELFLNGESRGRKKIDHAHGQQLTADWQLRYTDGEITAVAYDENGKEIARQSRHSFGDTAGLVSKVFPMDADDGLCFIEVSAVDKDGYPVENACDYVEVGSSGSTRILGLDNGDSTDTDEYKGRKKRLFGGKMLVIAQGKPEEVQFKLSGEQIRPREIRLSCSGATALDAEHREQTVTAGIFPKEAAVDPESLVWKCVNDAGIETNIAKAEAEGLCAKVTALGDGDFRLRCMYMDEAGVAKVISVLEFSARGLGAARLDPYSFIAGGLWSYSDGEPGIGNERGVSTKREERLVIGFENMDFGSYGSDRITIPIFVLGNDPFPFQLWDGIPEKGGELLLDAVYQKEMIWNVYQEESYTLKKRLKGVHSLYFLTHDKAHIAGFSFEKQSRAWSLISGGDCDAVYGDSYTKLEDRIEGIGNNVTVEFRDMDFGDTPAKEVEITGLGHVPVNTLHLLFVTEEGTQRDSLEFRAEAGETQRFPVGPFTGAGTLQLVFLPGSSFDLKSLRFGGEV